MAVTEQTRTHLIGLSVVMLGEAPGTDRLGDWVQRLDDGMSLEEVANHIAGSSAFRAEYPNFDTNRDFAKKFLGNLMGGEDVDATLVAGAVEIVVGLLNDGMTRGALALAVVGAMLDINAQGPAHPANSDLGGVAARLANQIEVAEYYTLEAGMADPSSGALDGVTSDAGTVATAIRDIDSPPADAMFDSVGDLSVDENAASGMVGAVTASDSNGDQVSYSLEDAPDGFSIDSMSGEISYAGDGLDHETMPTVDLTVVATSTGADGSATDVSTTVTVTVGDVPESDAVFGDVGDLSLEEHDDGSGDGNAINVGQVAATDAEGDAITYSIKGAPEGWAILEGGKLCYIGSGIDYETTQSVDLTVVASSYGKDGRMMTEVEQDVTVQITDLNDAVFGEVGELGLLEGASGSDEAVAVGAVSASDADGDTVSYRLAGPAVDSENSGILHSGFEIDANGAITYTGGGISRSVSQSVDLTVIATSRGDNGQDTDVEMMVTVDINAIQRSDAMFGEVGALMLNENADGSGDGNAINVGQVAATDAEGDAIAYSIKGDPEDWSIDGEGNLSYVGMGIDADGEDGMASVDLTIVATSVGANGEETAVEQAVSVDIVNLNDNAPMVGEAQGESSLRASTPEADTNTGLMFSVTDADGDVGEYSAAVYEGEGDDMAVSTRFKAVADEADSMSFHIVAIGGTEIGAGDVSLTIKASDGENESEASTVSLTVGEALPPEPVPGDVFNLTRTRDNVRGTVGDDTIIADPDANGLPTLNSFDTIDGGDGNDRLEIYDIEPSVDAGEGGGREGGLVIDSSTDAEVLNVEEVYIHARGEIDLELTEWEGLQSVELGRFGRIDDVSVTVDGASVSSSRAYKGEMVSIVGASGMVDLEAGAGTAVQVGSGAHTTSVMVKGGKTVNVNASGAGGQSQTVTSVLIDGVKGEGLGGDGQRGIPMEKVGVAIPDGNGTNSSPTADNPQYVMADGATGIDETAADFEQGYFVAADQTPTSGTLSANLVIVTMEEDEAAERRQVFKNGERVDPGTEDAVDGEDSGGVPVHINSDAIMSVSLSNTYATVAVVNASDDPEDLMVTVDGYGGDVAGKLCLTGDGAAENVSIMVAGDSNFALANNVTKTVSIDGDADLKLAVTNFVAPPDNVNAGGEETPAASATLESITMSGSGDVSIDVAGMGKLESIDASASSGANSVKGVGDSVTSVTGGSGADTVAVAAFADDGLTVNLGTGNDTFSSAGGNGKSRVNGGDGTDVLHLTGNSATHGKGDDTASIFSNFEVLEVGGSAEAAHDVSLLGVHAVSVSGTTLGAVTLNNMGDGMGITVNGKAGMGTTATVVHDMKARSAGDARYSGVLDVSLTANGSKDDTKTSGSGTATLTLTADEEIETLNVASSANPAGKASAATYQNSLILQGVDNAAGTAGVASNVEAIVVSGSARAEISVAISTNGTVAQFAELELVDAELNTGGVTFSADLSAAQDGSTVLAQKLEMAGGSGKDTFTGGGNDDELMGNGGNDTLKGGAGADTIIGGAGGDTLTGDGGADVYKYGSVSESQMSGFDTITDFDDGVDKISLGKSVFNGLHRGANIREVTADRNSATNHAINSTDDDATADGTNTFATANSLQAWLGNGEGVFKTSTGTGLDATTTQHAITTVTENYYRAATAAEIAANSAVDTDGDGVQDSFAISRTWILIDVDADGNFDAATDMVIAITGIENLANNGSDFIA